MKEDKNFLSQECNVTIPIVRLIFTVYIFFHASSTLDTFFSKKSWFRKKKKALRRPKEKDVSLRLWGDPHLRHDADSPLNSFMSDL